MDETFSLPPLCQSGHYRKDGTPIDLMEWGRLLNDRSYQVIRQTTLPGSKKWVSTVWLGIDHGFGESELPVIFETMVFPKKRNGFSHMACERWHTEAEAIAGHRAFCRWWRMNRRQRRRTLARRIDKIFNRGA
jgi:hypothetical protein